MKRIKEYFSAVKTAFGVTFKTCKWLNLCLLAVMFVMATLPVLNVYLLNLLLNEIISSDISVRSVTIYSVGLILGIAAESLFSELRNIITKTMDSRTELYASMNFYNRLATLPFSYVDSRQGRDAADGARGQLPYFAATYCTFLDIVFSLYTFVLSAKILFDYNVLFSILLLVFSVPGVITGYTQTALYDKFAKLNLGNNRYYKYYYQILTGEDSAKDVRLYGLGGPLGRKYLDYREKYLAERRIIKNKFIRYDFIFLSLQLFGVVGFIVSLVFAYASGAITIGELTMYASLAWSVCTMFSLIAGAGDMSVTFAGWLSFAFDFFSAKTENERSGDKEIDKLESIEFKNVFFKYPNTENNVLNGVSFKINKGERVSLLGINGAGKTTVVKLMTGLYDCDSGEILLNGVPILEYKRESVNKQFSVLFQDFAEYRLTLRENIALSDINNINNDKNIGAALEKSGSDDDIPDHMNKLDCFMGREFDDNGIELSRGQWQKIALARAYFKEAPVIILDEPSAALDAEAEDRVFRNFENIIEDNTAIMISHRISNAVSADKILVIDNGVIAESGSHKELIEKRGMYAKMYELQRSKYTAAEENRDE
ncbi:MAG: ABC transporter ATP-binding protein [Eubacteriales bacterium]|jgi:ATP-binding cassette subfamily B protein